MCGISFYCSSEANPAEELEKSMHAIRHRGPDDSGFFYKKIQDFFIGIGHNRLSILDLSTAGKQPMDLGLGTVISYNGEVYNYKELRQLLQSNHYNFRGDSDTEIVSLLYTELGIASFSLLQGMFAFVILDEIKQKLMVVRDGIGIKPLYLFQDETALFGSSEIRALKAFSAVKCDISEDDVFEFFNQGFLYEPATGYIAIKKLPPGHYLEFDLATGIQTIRRFNFKDTRSAIPLERKVSAAISQQLVADVPLGTFFSGGIDSSLIACHAKENDLFFAKYSADPSSDKDLEFSNKISTHLKKSLITSSILLEHQTADELMATVDFVAANSEELISDYTLWATYQLSLAARNKGYKVMLSGMGGDEIFAGYPRYLVLKYHAMVKVLCPLLRLLLWTAFFPKKWDKKFERLDSYGRENHWPSAYARLLGYFSRSDLAQFFGNATSSLEKRYKLKLDSIRRSFPGRFKDKVKLAQWFDLVGFLSHNLSVSDKASMLASIELRVPLLDESIVAHGLSIPSKQLLKKGQLKYALKTLLASLLPQHLTQRPKTGFNPPLEGLINGIGKERLKQEIQHAGCFIKLDALKSLLDDHFSGQANNTYKLWQLLYFSRWITMNHVK